MTGLRTLIADTLRECLRLRLLQVLVLLAMLIPLAIALAGGPLLDLQGRVLRDLCLALISLSGLGLALLLPVHLLRVEEERGTLLFTLTFPVSRTLWLTGKALGSLLFLATAGIVLHAGAALALFPTRSATLAVLSLSVLLFLFKCLVLVPLAQFFAQFCSRTSSFSLLSLILLTAHFKGALTGALGTSTVAGQTASLLVGWVLPDFSFFILPPDENTGLFLRTELPLLFLYAASLGLLWFLAADWVFRRRDPA